ncbi:hypothetical protein Flavo103_17250 [Flavobacterium collinsii]|jgi:1,2-diacylglycerol 3-alpha-glucosyltransferase|uniref:glycosyltransferase n=1 Tax=Flavobacterium collinsii TaxID=1114861 RepID=UPI0022BFA0D3|nr:glycosyltransferase [Flavobacterium collinsii]GIQ58589.1 hypothetical protein Flavo103_17250 [Flavobacterium collinsii]
MKIVHLCLSSFYIDNYSYQENMLPKYHVLQGHEVTVIASLVSFNSSGEPCLLEKESTKITEDGYKVIRVDYKKAFYKFNKFVRIYNGISELLELEKPDLIFMHDFSFLDVRKVISYVKKNRNVIMFVDCHTDYINSAQTWISLNIFHKLIWRYYAKKISPYVQKFYGTTPLRSDFLRDVYNIDSKKIELLVMGIDDDLIKNKDRVLLKKNYAEKLNFKESDFVIVTGGKIDLKKNVHLLMKAVSNLNKVNVKLVIFGIVTTEMKNDFDSLFNSDCMIYSGWQNSNGIVDHLMFADLVVFPGTHSVLWEQAVGVGTPSVFKYWQGMTHVDVGGNCEFLYKDDVNEIENVLDNILESYDKYNVMAKQALEKGLKYFSYSDISKRAIKSY